MWSFLSSAWSPGARKVTARDPLRASVFYAPYDPGSLPLLAAWMQLGDSVAAPEGHVLFETVDCAADPPPEARTVKERSPAEQAIYPNLLPRPRSRPTRTSTSCRPSFCSAQAESAWSGRRTQLISKSLAEP